ncbi:putative rnase3 domain protein [Phaeomoniella chlamydospora]|uniref:Putative rnase3 domain protein n=1 Tax=Phaeomoniella chlamydospora TaxID=158046 RepID=A0A0G2HHU8_PHACM|nr:putative rnase3 domain protein [Phaeomoniella chlamydospora]
MADQQLKRRAESQREGYSDSFNSRDSNDAPQKATAAQMAARNTAKENQPPPSQTPSFSGNIFNTAKENQPPSSQAPSPVFAFGGDKTVDIGQNKPANEQQTSNTVDFGAPVASSNQSNLFSGFGSQTVPNTSIFGAQTQSSGDTVMASPEKASGGANIIFGSSSTAQASSKPTFTFGAPQNGVSNSSVFGNSKASESDSSPKETPSSVFQPSIFAKPATNADPASSANPFGQSQAANSFSGFGKPTTTEPAKQEGQTKPLFAFAQPAASEKANSAPSALEHPSPAMNSQSKAPQATFGQSAPAGNDMSKTSPFKPTPGTTLTKNPQELQSTRRSKSPEKRYAESPEPERNWVAPPKVQSMSIPGPARNHPIKRSVFLDAMDTVKKMETPKLQWNPNSQQFIPRIHESLFVDKPISDEDHSDQNTQATPSANESGSSDQATKPKDQETDQKSGTRDIFQSKPATPTTKNLFANALKSAESATKPLPASQASASSPTPDTTTKKPVRVETLGPAKLPTYLNEDGRSQVDRMFRLRGLNASFKTRVAALDPASSDLDTLIRFYVASRENIGESVGLYQRAQAGSKRKIESTDRTDDEVDNSKKPRSSLISNDRSDKLSNPTQSIASQSPLKFNFSSGNSSFDQSKTSSVQAQPASNPLPSQTQSKSPNNLFGQSASASAQSQPATNIFRSNASTQEVPKANMFQKALEKPSENPQASDKDSSSRPVSTSGPTFTPKFTVGYNQSKSGGVKIPQFGAVTSGSNDFLSQFGAQSKKNVEMMQQEEKEKRKAEDFDSDEDDEAEFDRKLEEERAAKRARIEELSKSSSTFFKLGSGTSSDKSGDGKSDQADQGKPASWFPTSGSSTPSTANGASVFESLKSGSPQSFSNTFASFENNQSPSDDDQDDDDEDHSVDYPDDETEDPSYDPDQDADQDDSENAEVEAEVTETVKPSGPSLFDRLTPKSSSENEEKMTEASNTGRSLFDRLTPKPTSDEQNATNPAKPLFGSNTISTTPAKPLFGSATMSTTPKGQAGNGIFGAGNGTPANGDSKLSDSLFGSTPKPGDNIFGSTPKPVNGDSKLYDSLIGSNPKPGGSIFGSTSKPFGDHTWKPDSPIKFGGTPSVNLTAASPPKQLFSNLFGSSSTSSAPNTTTPSVGFSFGAPPASNSLAPSVFSSAGTSRATSPGATDDSAPENSEDVPKDEQLSLMDSRPGEENEDTLYEARAKLLKWDDQGKTWASMGLGTLRILKDKHSGKTRMLLRSEPGASILLNTLVRSSITYKPMASDGRDTAAVKFADVLSDGQLAQRVLKVKSVTMAQEMAKILTSNAQ